jgi:hypothetical protein
MIDNGGVVLQNCISLLEIVPGSCSETCLTSHDDNQIIDIKVENVADAQEEEDPLLITSQVIKTENEVSCVSVRVVRRTSETLLVLFMLCLIALWFQMYHMYDNIPQDSYVLFHSM